MILKYFELNKINFKIYKLLLFYGKNEGLKDEKIKELIKKCKGYKIQRYDEKEILDNEEDFHNNILNGSLFENQKIIIINKSSDKIISIIDTILEKKIDDVIFIIVANILEKKSKLRSHFEKDKNLICVPFYEDTTETLFKLTQKFFNEIKFPISTENINIIVNKCAGDRESLNNELKKLEFFLKDKKKLETSDLIKLINLSENFSVNELIDTCLSKNEKKTINILNENNFSTEDCIIIIRTFLIKSKRILKLLYENEVNNNINKTIAEAKPPIFWKDKDIVRQQITNWTPIKLKEVIYYISDLELQIKKNNINQVNIIIDFLLDKSRVKTNS